MCYLRGFWSFHECIFYLQIQHSMLSGLRQAQEMYEYHAEFMRYLGDPSLLFRNGWRFLFAKYELYCLEVSIWNLSINVFFMKHYSITFKPVQLLLWFSRHIVKLVWTITKFIDHFLWLPWHFNRSLSQVLELLSVHLTEGSAFQPLRVVQASVAVAP